MLLIILTAGNGRARASFPEITIYVDDDMTEIRVLCFLGIVVEFLRLQGMYVNLIETIASCSHQQVVTAWLDDVIHTGRLDSR